MQANILTLRTASTPECSKGQGLKFGKKSRFQNVVILHIKVIGMNCKNVFPSLMIVFVLTGRVDPGEMSLDATFHLDLHYLPKYIFSSR